MPLERIDTTSLERVDDRIAELCKLGLLRNTTIPISLPPLTDERHLYRLTDYGRYHAAQTRSRSERRTLVAIEEASLTSGWADEDAIWIASYPGYKDRKAVRFRIRRMVTMGWIESRVYPTPNSTSFLVLTSKGLDRINRQRGQRGGNPMRATRTPREDQVVHHLLCVQAAIRILTLTGGKLLRLHGDEDLRSFSRTGRRLRSGSSDEKLPDGRLVLRLQDGSKRAADIEILTSKYTDEVILKKYDELSEATYFFAPTPALVERTEALVGRRPHLL